MENDRPRPETRPKLRLQHCNDLDTSGTQKKMETKDYLEKDTAVRSEKGLKMEPISISISIGISICNLSYPDWELQMILWADTKIFLIGYGISRTSQISSSLGGQWDRHEGSHSSNGAGVTSDRLNRGRRVHLRLLRVATVRLSGGIIRLHLVSCATPFASHFIFPQAVYCLYFLLFFSQKALCKYQRVNLLPSARFSTVYSLLSTQRQTKTNKQGGKKLFTKKQYLNKQ